MKFIVPTLIVIIGVLYCTSVVIAETEQVSDPVVWSEIVDQASKLLGIDNFITLYLLTLLGFRLLAEGGGIIANKTENKFDNKVVKVFSKVVNAMAWATGLLGIGSPKNVRKPIK